MAEVRRVIDWLAKKRGFKFEIEEGLVGGCAYDAHGVPLTDETMARALSADAVLLGAVGGPKWDSLPFEKKPERGLLRLRKDMELFANLRPALCFPALADASSLKRELVEGLDILIVRELTGGVYFGEPRGISTLPNGERKGVNTQVYTTGEIRRVARVAFDLARKRSKRVTSVEKANVMEFGRFVARGSDASCTRPNFPTSRSRTCMPTIAPCSSCASPSSSTSSSPTISSAICSRIARPCSPGSLGMLPSASLGATDAKGKRRALYEPVHGSAPDIAGRGVANPLATILSFAMALRYSFGREAEAKLIEGAVDGVLGQGFRTADIMQPGMKKVGTRAMGDAVLAALDAAPA